MTDGLIHGWLARATELHPERDAVAGVGSSLTYQALDDASSRLARLLIENGVSPGDRVGLFLEKSPAAVVGIYGVLKAGATYVPFDEQAPVARLGYIARNANIRFLITSEARAADWDKLVTAGAPLEALFVADAKSPLDAPAGVRMIPGSELAAYSPERPSVSVDADSLAYVLYTSGSTGEPKGVMLSHRNALAFVEWAAALLRLQPEDRLSSHAPFHFDLSTFDLFAAAVAGATVVLVPRETSVFPVELARFISDERISVWYSVPSILTMLLLHGSLEKNPPVELHTVLYAGESFPSKHLRALMDVLPRTRFYNLFGPTETNVCTWYEVPRPATELPDEIPIGKPIEGVSIIVADEQGLPMPPGEVGELLVHGPTVMHGYLGKPEQTASVLGVHSQSGERLYHTGDLVREDADRNLLFLGRRDAQIKSRGYRIELGEIERTLYALDEVVDCAVVAVPDEVVTNRLKAFIVLRTPLSEAAIVSFCLQHLPRYMIPEQIEFRDSLPKSSTGKIDRRQLTS